MTDDTRMRVAWDAELKARWPDGCVDLATAHLFFKKGYRARAALADAQAAEPASPYCACPDCLKRKDVPSDAERADWDEVLDARRWRCLPAFIEKFQIDYVGLKRAIDAYISAAPAASAVDGIHSCSYQCQRTACIKAQRDELVRRYVDGEAAAGGAEQRDQQMNREIDSAIANFNNPDTSDLDPEMVGFAEQAIADKRARAQEKGG